MLTACGSADKSNSKIAIVSPSIEALKGRSENIEVQFKLTNVGLNCEMRLGTNLKLKDSSCLTIPKGQHVYRFEYDDKASNTLIAWAEDSFTLGDSDMEILFIN